MHFVRRASLLSRTNFTRCFASEVDKSSLCSKLCVIGGGKLLINDLFIDFLSSHIYAFHIS